MESFIRRKVTFHYLAVSFCVVLALLLTPAPAKGADFDLETQTEMESQYGGQAVLEAFALRLGCTAKEVEMVLNSKAATLEKLPEGGYKLCFCYDQQLGNDYRLGGGHIIIMEDDIL